MVLAGGEGSEDQVSGTAAEAALREAEQGEQERGGEHARVVLEDRDRIAEAAGERRARPRGSGKRRVDERQSDPKRRVSR